MFPIRFPGLLGRQYLGQQIQMYLSGHENRKMSFKFKYLFKKTVKEDLFQYSHLAVNRKWVL